MSELQTQVLEKGLCFHCHARTLKNVPDTTIYHCMRCRRVYIAEHCGRVCGPKIQRGLLCL